MLSNVVKDLQAFMLFFGILVFLIALIMNVLGVANHQVASVEGVRENALKDFYNYA